MLHYRFINIDIPPISKGVDYVRYSSGIDQCGIHEVFGTQVVPCQWLPSYTAITSSLSIRHLFLMINKKVYEVTMELCYLYSLLDKSDETLWLSLSSLNTGKTSSQKKTTTYLTTDICLF